MHAHAHHLVTNLVNHDRIDLFMTFPNIRLGPVDGGRSINTQDLHAMLIGPNPPVTINAIFSKSQVTSIPGSIWLPASGQGGAFDDDMQTQLASTLANITDDDFARPIVVYCLDAQCWLSYNAALRFRALGYENLYWYRGGIAARKAANLPTRMASR